MGKNIFSMIFLSLMLTGCSHPKTAAPPVNPQIDQLRTLVAKGNYEEAINLAKDITARVPPAPGSDEALFLQGYILAYDRSDFQGARSPLKQLLDLSPAGNFAPSAQRLLSDCRYWDGNYEKAIKEYKKLLALYGDKGFSGYAQFQIANCLLLNEKVGDALTAYRELVEKNPTDPLADSAQLMVANTYLKLQNLSQAKTELQKLMSISKNRLVQSAVQKELRQMEEEEPFRKGVGVPE
jgi:tetratricopeptide (TPR) repeat protein